MTPLELQDWLLEDGIKAELEQITRWTVITELDNLEVNLDFGLEINWERLLLAGSVFQFESRCNLVFPRYFVSLQCWRQSDLG